MGSSCVLDANVLHAWSLLESQPVLCLTVSWDAVKVVKMILGVTCINEERQME